MLRAETVDGGVVRQLRPGPADFFPRHLEVQFGGFLSELQRKARQRDVLQCTQVEQFKTEHNNPGFVYYFQMV